MFVRVVINAVASFSYKPSLRCQIDNLIQPAIQYSMAIRKLQQLTIWNVWYIKVKYEKLLQLLLTSDCSHSNVRNLKHHNPLFDRISAQTVNICDDIRSYKLYAKMYGDAWSIHVFALQRQYCFLSFKYGIPGYGIGGIFIIIHVACSHSIVETKYWSHNVYKRE